MAPLAGSLRSSGRNDPILGQVHLDPAAGFSQRSNEIATCLTNMYGSFLWT